MEPASKKPLIERKPLWDYEYGSAIQVWNVREKSVNLRRVFLKIFCWSRRPSSARKSAPDFAIACLKKKYETFPKIVINHYEVRVITTNNDIY